MTVGVVGAGITGLALCHHLVARDVPVRVFEADERPGGAIRSTVTEGSVLEHGPQRLRGSPGVDELVEAVGLADEVVTGPSDLPLFVYADGELRTVPTSVRRFLGTDLLSWRGKLRVLAEPLTKPGQPDETAAELFRRKFGDEAYENMLGPMFGGLYGSDPERMPVSAALSGLLRLEAEAGSLLRMAVGRTFGGGQSSPPMSFEAGLQRLPDGLAAHYADHVSLGRPVTGIEPRDDGFRVMARGEFMAADEVVLTTPADATADLLEPLDAEAATVLRGLTYNPLAIVHLRADVDARGMGYQVRHDEGLATLGVTWNDALFDREGLFTAFLGGMRNPGLVDDDPAAIGRRASSEFEQVMGTPAEVLNVTRLPRAMPAWDESWAALDDLSLPEGLHLATNYTGRVGIPSRIRVAEGLAERFAA